MSQLTVNFETYSKLVRALASLSGLFTTSNIAYVDSKFIELLYVRTADAENFAFSDMSFDAILRNAAGVGVKTFRASSISGLKKEKVAEFPRAARDLQLHTLNGRDLALAVAELRNKRIASDAAEYNVALSRSIYHCLVRLESGFFIHEEPYSLIDVDSISPLNSRGAKVTDWPREHDHIHFSDGVATWGFNVSKNVLYKRFDLDTGVNSPLIPISISSNPFEVLNSLEGSLLHTETTQSEKASHVVLPLYSTKGGVKYVAPKSGINQWNGGGRKRSFGEAYIPVPSVVHKQSPGFFPPRDEQFELQLPNGDTVKAKICQDGDKALMSDPNVELVQWLFAAIDGSFDDANKRLGANRPYSYEDLLSVGKDCVEVRKVSNHKFEMRMRPLGDFEEFLESVDEY